MLVLILFVQYYMFDAITFVLSEFMSDTMLISNDAY